MFGMLSFFLNFGFLTKTYLLIFSRFCSELGPGSVIFGFYAKNCAGWTNFQPNPMYGRAFWAFCNLRMCRLPVWLEPRVSGRRRQGRCEMYMGVLGFCYFFEFWRCLAIFGIFGILGFLWILYLFLICFACFLIWFFKG